MTDSIRVRIAPSPTGTVHLGLARTALFNWAYARRRGGAFLLRIEDTDRERSTKESERAILEGLSWLGIDWDEGPDVGGPHAPYYQSQRVERHKELAARLLEQGAAYRCFCTKERLDELRETQMKAKGRVAYDRRCRDLPAAEVDAKVAAGEPGVVRFRVPDGETSFTDLVRGDVRFDNREVDDWIMLRADGSPTYNFVVVCDDADMQITHVFRGEEHLVNTPKQVLLYRALGGTPPQFGHLPLMLGKDKKKLSKRSGDTSLEDYRRNGFARKAIINFLALQGWALDGERDLFSVDEFVENFDVASVSKGGAVFDLDKFVWMSGEYIRAESVPELAQNCAPHLIAAGHATAEELQERQAWFERVVALAQDRIQLYSEFPAKVAFFFAADDAVQYEPGAEKNARKHEARLETLAAFDAWLAEQPTDLAPAALGDAAKAWMKERELKFPQLFQPLRCALSGQAGGPDLFELIDLLGRESAGARLRAGIERLG